MIIDLSSWKLLHRSSSFEALKTCLLGIAGLNLQEFDFIGSLFFFGSSVAAND